nr:immunoglobulin light chain junction region [Macaca mulatta]
DYYCNSYAVTKTFIF